MTNFTSRQKEIVARKLGYDGPMQGFDDFLNSSPALSTQYSMLSDKFATRMAKGGAVRKKFAVGGAVPSYFQANPDVAAAYQQNTYGLSPEQFAQTHYEKFGAAEQRAAPVMAAPTPPAPVAAAPASAPKVSDQDVSAWFRENPNASDATIAAAMQQYNVTPEQISKATGVSTQDVQSRYEAALAPATMSATETAAYFAANPDVAEGYNQNSFGYTPEQFAGVHYQKFGKAEDRLSPTPVVSDQDVYAWFQENPNASDVDIAVAMKTYGVTPEQISKVTGVSAKEVQDRYYAALNTDAAKKAQEALAKANAALAAAKTEAERQAALAAQARANTAVSQAGVSATGAPTAPTATTYTALQTAITPGMTPTAQQAGATQQAGVTNVAAPTPVGLPSPITAPTITAATAAPAITGMLTGLEAQQGVVSAPALATAATQAPETTAVAGMQAAQGVAGTVQGAPTREVQAGEMVSGPAVDMAKVEQTLAQTQAAQGVVTEDMTVQGQLNKLLTNFDAGAPPPWAAASMRAATAQLAARGLGASSMAGQAIIQATLEAATPIAAADAKVFETMGLQNLSNRQQTAMLVGQQRAQFLGQEFDQAFQTRVLNAARVADIANKNFDAQTQIAIENSRLANSMDIANLSARNAVVLGKMAQMSQLETMNLNNRQQVAVENAKAFLTMDIKNLDNRQQTSLFRAQEMADALISDAGFANAANITNASNALDASKVSAQLALSAETFNADMLTKVNMSNALAANELAKFNAQQANAREEFNSNMANQINLANAKILAEISTANTAAVNAANAVNAKNATDLSAAAYAQQSQTYRDLLEMSWKTGESTKDRATTLAAAALSANASTSAAQTTADSKAIAQIGSTAVTLLSNYDKVKQAFTDVGNLFD